MGYVFLTLLNRSITAGWLVLAVLTVRFLFRRMPKWTCCLLWAIVAIRLLLPFSIESAFSLQPSAEPILVTSGIEINRLSSPLADGDAVLVERPTPYEMTESMTPLQIVVEIAEFVWLCGMILFLAFAVVSTVRLHRLVREGVCYQKNCYLCDAAATPFILGMIYPKIYLPSTLDEQERNYVLAHEQAHLQRLDYIWKAAGYLLLSVYWFNPLLFIAYSFLCKDIELACDEKVIKDMAFPEKKAYSKVLLSCATQKKLVLTYPLAFGEISVKERVKNILSNQKNTRSVTILGIVVCIILAVCFLTNPAKTVSAEKDSSVYGKVIEGLGDKDAYALLNMNYAYPVLLTSDLIYDEGTEKQASISCDVYYYRKGGAKRIGAIMSDGTAYPITFTRDGIFATSGHKVEKYGISQDGALYLQQGIYEQFDENGNVIYVRIVGEQEQEATEQEYLELLEEYGESQTVHFFF